MQAAGQTHKGSATLTYAIILGLSLSLLLASAAIFEKRLGGYFSKVAEKVATPFP